MKFYYAPRGDFDLDFARDICTPCRNNNPPWYKDMGFFLQGAKSVKDYWSKLSQPNKLQAEAFTTIKACPGFRDLFANSFIIKFPCDLLLETKEDGGFTWKIPSSDEILKIMNHNSEQMVSPVTDKYLVFKFELPYLMAGKGNTLVFMDPIYWKEQPYKVVPGVVKLHDVNRGLGFSVLIFIEKKDSVYHFKKGEPMALLYMPEKTQMVQKKLRTFVKKEFILEYGKK